MMHEFETRHNFDDGESVVRLYDKDGNHKMSILPCGYNGEKLICDIALPSGKVLYCGIDEGLLQVFIDNLGVEKI